MFNAPTQKDLNIIDSIFQHFKGQFPNVNDKDLYDRIYSGYCWGEGKVAFLTNIRVWDNIFQGNKSYTIFKDWEEYFKYKGNPFKHPEAYNIKNKQNLL